MIPDESPTRERKRTWRDVPLEAGLSVPPAETPEARESHALRRSVFRTGLVVVCTVFAFSVSWHTESAPQHALVLRDGAAKVYLSPSCALGRGTLPISSIAEARKAGLSPDPACEKSGGFLGANQTVLQETLARIYLYLSSPE